MEDGDAPLRPQIYRLKRRRANALGQAHAPWGLPVCFILPNTHRNDEHNTNIHGTELSIELDTPVVLLACTRFHKKSSYKSRNTRDQDTLAATGHCTHRPNRRPRRGHRCPRRRRPVPHAHLQLQPSTRPACSACTYNAQKAGPAARSCYVTKSWTMRSSLVSQPDKGKAQTQNANVTMAIIVRCYSSTHAERPTTRGHHMQHVTNTHLNQ